MGKKKNVQLASKKDVQLTYKMILDALGTADSQKGMNAKSVLDYVKAHFIVGNDDQKVGFFKCI